MRGGEKGKPNSKKIKKSKNKMFEKWLKQYIKLYENIMHDFENKRQNYFG